MTDHSWETYRMLFEQELEDTRAFRKEMRAVLEEMGRDITELKTQRSSVAWFTSVVLPIIISIVVSGVAAAAR